MSDLKAAIIEPVGGHGGMHYYDFELARGLFEAGIFPFIYTCDETLVPDNTPFLINRVFRGIYGQSPALLRGYRFVRGLLQALACCRKHRISLAHFHFFHYTPLEFVSVLLFRMAGFKVFITAHDVESFTGGSSAAIGRATYGLAHHVIAHNIASKHELIERLGMTSDRISVIPHGNYVDVIRTDISKEKARSKLSLPIGDPLLLFFGHIKKVKGLDLLLEAMPEVLRVIPQAKLCIAGKVWHDSFEVYNQLISKNGLDHAVRTDIRYIPDKEADYYYRAADVVVLPYKKIYQSGVLLMAMSHAKPVIVSNLPGMTEIVRDGINGAVCKANDPSSLARSILETLGSCSKMAQYSSAAYTTVTDRHNWIHVGRLTAEAYRAAVKLRGRTA